MAYIYKITNLINGKLYIGKTYKTIQKRFQEHCADSKKEHCEQRPLYAAFNKYGIENFSIEEIEQTDNPEERERYWIEYYGSFKNGYNATLGGDGKSYIDYDLVIATYKETLNCAEVARIMQISKDSVYNILKDRGEQALPSGESTKRFYGKIVNQYSLTDEYIRSFASAQEAARFLGKITSSSRGATSHITDVCKGKRKTAYGYKWKWG